MYLLAFSVVLYPCFWLSIPITVMASLLPDFIILAVTRAVYPKDYMVYLNVQSITFVFASYDIVRVLARCGVL